MKGATLVAVACLVAVALAADVVFPRVTSGLPNVVAGNGIYRAWVTVTFNQTATLNVLSDVQNPFADPRWNGTPFPDPTGRQLRAVAQFPKDDKACPETALYFSDTQIDYFNSMQSTFFKSETFFNPTTDFAWGAVDGTLVVAGGTQPDSKLSDNVQVFECFGFLANKQLSVKRTRTAVAVVGSKIVFAGGSNGTNSQTNAFDVYDVSQGDIISSGILSQARDRIAAATAGNMALFVGGRAGPSPSAVVDLYNGNNGMWSTATIGPNRARWGMTGVSCGNTALFIGGDQGDGKASQLVDYYIADNGGFWEQADLLVGRRDFATAVIGPLVIVAGGRDDEGKVHHVMDVFDIRSQTWANLRLATARYWPGGLAQSGTVNDRTVVFQGGLGTDGKPVLTLEAYDRDVLENWINSQAINQTYTNVFSLEQTVEHQFDDVRQYVDQQVGAANILIGNNTDRIFALEVDVEAQVGYLYDMANNNSKATKDLSVLVYDNHADSLEAIDELFNNDRGLNNQTAALRAQVDALTKQLNDLTKKILPACLANQVMLGEASPCPSGGKDNKTIVLAAVIGSLAGITIAAGGYFLFQRRKRRALIGHDQMVSLNEPLTGGASASDI